MNWSKQNIAKNYLIIGASFAAIGATKGLVNGLCRTHQREVNDGGPSIHTKDSISGVIGSTGIIVSATTLLGTFEGGMVGLLWPINLPWGLYQYIRNYLIDEEISGDTDRETEEELVMAHGLEEISTNVNTDNPFINLQESLPELVKEE
jgi:hypothetical protein